MKLKKTERRTDYSKIRRKLYLNITIAVIVSIALVAFLRGFIQHRAVVGDWIVNVLMRSFYLDFEDAMKIYQYSIRNNMEVFLYIAIAICFFFLCRAILSRFMRYFDQVNTGLDLLIQGDGRQIEFPPEMDFFEHKLNTLRQTLEKREQDAKLAEQRKNDLVMYLAHDIKTPLTSVVGYLSLLSEAPDMPIEQKAKYVNIALDKAYRLEQLIDEFFEITRYNFQTITLTKKDIDLYYMLVQMADEFYPQLAASRKRMDIHCSEDLTVYGDPDKLARVFNNILKNAVAYSEADAAIDINAELHESIVIIKFMNRGTIPESKLLSVFEKFYRLDNARSTDSGGAGLGLSIAKEIVLLHDGRIYAECVDGCTIFTVELPVMQDSTANESTNIQ